MNQGEGRLERAHETRTQKSLQSLTRTMQYILYVSNKQNKTALLFAPRIIQTQPRYFQASTVYNDCAYSCTSCLNKEHFRLTFLNPNFSWRPLFAGIVLSRFRLFLAANPQQRYLFRCFCSRSRSFCCRLCFFLALFLQGQHFQSLLSSLLCVARLGGSDKNVTQNVAVNVTERMPGTEAFAKQSVGNT